MLEDHPRAREWLYEINRRLRRVLGTAAWSLRGSLCTLALAFEDAGREFEEQAALAATVDPPADQRRAAGERALALAAGGPYLEWCEAQWAIEERERLRQLVLRTALTSAALCLELGWPDAALAAGDRAIAADPLAEEPRRLQMSTLIGLGRLDEALVVYFQAADLRPPDLARWRALRVQLSRRQETRRAQRRFRRDPAAYLAQLEADLLKLTLPE